MSYYTIQQLEIFFTIVDCGTMSGASERLYLTQPSLSKTLKRLEEALGFALFKREANKLQLTSEGEFFYMRAKPLYQKLNELINTTQNMSRGRSMLRVGYYVGCDNRLIQKKAEQLRQLHPDIDVLENVMDLRALRDGLSMGKLDVIFSMSYAVKKIADGKMKVVQHTQLYLLMNEDNPMAVSGKLDVNLLNDYTMFFCTTIETQTFEQNDLKRCREIGFKPKRVVYLENSESCIRAVSRGEGICLSSTNEKREGIYAFALPWLRSLPEIVAVWLEHNHNAALKEFLALFENVNGS